MFSEKLDKLIEDTIVNGELSSTDRRKLQLEAKKEGWSLEEFDIILYNRLYKKYRSLNKKPEIRKESKAAAFKKQLDAIEGYYTKQIKELNEAIKEYDASGYINMVSKLREEISKLKKECRHEITEKFKNTSVPPTKEDILEFLLLLRPYINPSISSRWDLSVEDAVYFDWYKKCEIIAKSNFINDPAVRYYFDEIDSEKEKARKKKEDIEKQIEIEKENKERNRIEREKKRREDEQRQTLVKFEKDILEARRAKYKGFTDDAKLSNKIKTIVTIINTFELPTAKEDLIPLMKKLKQYYDEKKWDPYHNDENWDRELVENPSEIKVYKAYKDKYLECCDLVQRYYKDDPEFEPLLLQKNKKSNFNVARIFYVILLIILIIFLYSVLINQV